ncbi:MAG: NADH-quinone oxidoreductase subunit N, partial [Verrucomicrobiota bacterium]
LFKVQWPDPEAVKSSFWNYYALGDGRSLFYKGIAIVTTLVVLIMAVDFRQVVVDQTADPEEGAHPQAGLGEFFALPMFACAGLMWMASATNLVSIFVSLEVVTIAFYVMVAYLRRNVGSIEAGVKYLILGALSTGFLVYGFTWLYGMTGSMDLATIGERLASGEVNETGALFAFGLILLAMAFKVGAAPFHNWIPDVYQGAPTPITAFLSVGSKAAGFLVFTRIVTLFLGSGYFTSKVTIVLMVLAGLTLVIGNLTALPQKNFKRLLAYSSIAHAGFLLMALAASPKQPDVALSQKPITVISFYLGAYLLMTLLAFLVMNVVRSKMADESVDAYAGLAKRSPFLAFGMLVSMASLAGIPLTVGFCGKLFVFKLAFESQQWVLLVLGVIGACAGFYYYLKIAASMFMGSPKSDADTGKISVSPLTAIAIVLLIITIVWLGINPSALLAMAG